MYNLFTPVPLFPHSMRNQEPTKPKILGFTDKYNILPMLNLDKYF